jgi:hypothetical protein
MNSFVNSVFTGFPGGIDVMIWIKDNRDPDK